MSDDTEQAIRDLHRAGDVQAALALAVEKYGAEVYGFLLSRLRDEEAANDALGQAWEDLCASIGAFGWRCSMRTWMYKLARSAAARQRRGPHDKNVPLSQVSEQADRLRSRTREYLRSDVKDAFTKLRDELAPEDQTLLILRVDRGLEWSELAEVVSDAELSQDELVRASARLRQRFKTLKEQLRHRAIEVGLIE